MLSFLFGVICGAALGFFRPDDVRRAGNWVKAKIHLGKYVPPPAPTATNPDRPWEKPVTPTTAQPPVPPVPPTDPYPFRQPTTGDVPPSSTPPSSTGTPHSDGGGWRS